MCCRGFNPRVSIFRVPTLGTGWAPRPLACITRDDPARIPQAVVRVGILKHATAYALRHSFATQLLAAGTDIQTIQLLLGHRIFQTTMIYTHLLEVTAVSSPLDAL